MMSQEERDFVKAVEASYTPTGNESPSLLTLGLLALSALIRRLEWEEDPWKQSIGEDF